MISFTDIETRKLFDKTKDFILNKYEKKYKELRSTHPDELTDEDFIIYMYVTTWKELLRYIRYSDDLNRRTPYTRKYFSEQLIDRNIYENNFQTHLFISLSFIWEYILSIHSTKDTPETPPVYNMENVRKLDKIKESAWNNKNSEQRLTFSWIVDIMPYNMYRDLILSAELQEAKKISGSIVEEKEKLKREVSNIIEQATSSVEYLDSVRNDANDLGERLTNIKREGNFKLLAKAFSTLRKNKKWEARFAQARMWAFVLSLISLPLVSFWHFQHTDIPLDLKSFLKYTPLISLEVLFFYFMRLFYIEVKSIKSQLVQIDLRLNLCEFIYDYIETRDKTHSDKVNDSWKAFESLIFSPIQPNEDKIPSVMDGTDALADLAGKILKAKQSKPNG